MLRDLDLNRENCNLHLQDPNGNKIPLTNEHGDIFHRANDYDDCGPMSGEGGYEDFPPNQNYYNNQRPSPVESDYFYDQYVDYPINETVGNVLNSSIGRFNQTSPYVDFNQNKFNQNLLPPSRPPPASQFTFFGHPLPSLTLGNVWGQGRTANNRANSGENSSRGKGRVQIFRPGDPALQVISNRPTNDLDLLDVKNREPAASDKKPVIGSPLENMDEKFYRPYPYFQTPFSPPPKTEKGFSPLIPGMTIGGFIPILDPTKNETKIETKIDSKLPDWPGDENYSEVQLVTRAESQTKRTSTHPSTAFIDKIGSSTVSHLATSLSPIFSTLGPRFEPTTERTVSEEASEEVEEEEETTHEIESRNPNRGSLEEEIYRRTQEIKQVQAQSSTTVFVTSTTESNAENEDEISMPLPSSTTTESVHVSIPKESVENFDEIFDNFNESSSLSNEHLIAPGSILNQDVPSKAALLPPKAGKITKVFTPVPPAGSNEISKLLNPFYPQQHSSEPPTSYDNESQPNQLYTLTVNENERISETPQYDREDMDWYFTNYNQSQSNPILNYNLQPYDNYERSSADKLYFKCISSAIVLIVIRVLML